MVRLESHSMNSSPMSPMFDSLIGLTDLASVLMECFALILVGYLSGRLGLIPEKESKGLSAFVTYFSLPALIFQSLATLQLSDISWTFVLSLLVSKAVLFVSVVAITAILTKPSHIGKSGLYAIFCTQSNDFALGYPLLQSLYGSSNPQFARYLYVLAPIQLVILNPIGLFLMEIHKYYRREDRTQHNNYRKILFSVFIGIVKNPIIFMTILGIGWNLMFDSTIPKVLSPLLQVLSNSFSATALFLLGLNFVGKFKIFNGSSNILLVPLVLVMTKILILPLLNRVIIQNIMTNSNNETLELSNFGFLYGTFPSAPTVFIFALQYDFGISSTIVSTGMVMSTILSAPLMFVSANMIRISSNSLPYTAFKEDLGLTMSYSGLLSIFCVLWVLIVLLCGHKWKSVSHRCTIVLALSQLAVGIGGFLWQYIDDSGTVQRFYLVYHLQYMFAVGGILSSRIWTAMLSITLALLHCKSLCFVIRIHKKLSTFAAFITICLLFMVIYIPNYPTNKKIDPNFEFGDTQAYISIFLLISSLFATVVGLITQQHFRCRLTYYQSLSDNSDNADDSLQVSQPVINESNIEPTRRASVSIRGRVRTFSNQSNRSTNENAIIEVEDLIAPDFTFRELCSHTSNCSVDRRKHCESHIRRYRHQIEEANEVTPLFHSDINNIVDRYSADYHQIFHHIFLLLTLLLSMLVGLTVSIGKLVLEKPSGILIELEFLDILLNYGQGVITFLIFGLDTTPVYDQISKLLWNRNINNDSFLKLPDIENIRPATKQICEQFNNFHKLNCINDIQFERKIGQNNVLVFHGKGLVDWLIAAGLASDRNEAESYARNLLIGRVIEHVTQCQHFYDATFLYRFI